MIGLIDLELTLGELSDEEVGLAMDDRFGFGQCIVAGELWRADYRS